MNIEVFDDGKSFIRSVSNMREAQRNYFRTRDRTALLHAKEMEKEVDEQIDAWKMDACWRNVREEQPELFARTERREVV
jgi:hypothetical protein